MWINEIFIGINHMALLSEIIIITKQSMLFKNNTEILS